VHGTDKAFLLQHARWFLLPSAQENFGIAVLEAIQEKCPVVISDEVYLADHLPPAAQILPVTRDAWVGFLREKLDDETLRSNAAESLYAHACTTFDHDRIAEVWASTLAGLFTVQASVA
jgi:glycosyltransferase involved in cell wall biosynthesis